MAIDPLYARCTKRAAELLGGFDKLGALLSISPVIVERWANGLATPPADVFLQIIDIVLSDGPGGETPSASRRKKGPRPKSG
jgi:hypothetical protein